MTRRVLTHNGLTLVELLLTVLLFSAILLSVAGLVRSGLQVQSRMGHQVVPYQHMERALNRMERDLESAQRLFAVPFGGAAAQLEFTRVEDVPTAEGAAGRDWVRVRYHIEDGQLIREEWLWRNTDPHAEPLHRDMLMPLAEGGFAFGVLDGQQQLTWTDAWDGQKQGVPRLVRFEYTLPPTEGRAAVSLTRVIRNPAGNLPKVETP